MTCYSCHRGSDRPKVTPSLAEQYGTPPPDDPDEFEIAAIARAGPFRRSNSGQIYRGARRGAAAGQADKLYRQGHL